MFFYGGHDNLDVGGRYNVVRNNVFHNEEAYYADTTEDSARTRRAAVISGTGTSSLSNYGQGPGTAHHTLIEGNRIGYAGTPPRTTTAPAGSRTPESTPIDALQRHLRQRRHGLLQQDAGRLP
ncbi:MAG: hypothetical protein M0C28_27715 [Candidatus Moduliflexus flocculans]|nr:hypothetical protein [Candidatus Moduliflexus flocculans]